MTPRKPTVCFDTSTFNALLDDEAQDYLVSAIAKTTRPLITSLAMVEVVATPNDQRRTSLLLLMKRLSAGTRPLAMPNDLLQRATHTFGQSDPQLVLTVTGGDMQFWSILDNPELATEDRRRQALRWKTALEDSFRSSHESARGKFQELFNQQPSDRPRSVAGLFRYFMVNEEPIYRLVAKSYRKMTGKTLARVALRQLFLRVPGWPLYLAAWGHEMFARAISETNYGRRGKPGNLDLWAGAYLPYCDIFVTNDLGEGKGGQFRALRLLNRLVPLSTFKPFRTRVLTYKQFKSKLLSGGGAETT